MHIRGPFHESKSPLTWARAAFEQGALPSLLLLPGLVPIFTLPGDKMYQSFGICRGKQRPPIIHAYGGAKRGMASALATIAVEGWIPLAAAMVGTHDKPPMWARTGLQPVIGTTIDLKVAPAPVSDRDLRLLLSCWKRWDAKVVSGSALATWLGNVQSELGPECDDSPLFRKVDIDMLEAARLLNESGFQFLPEKELQDLPEMEIIMSVGLRLCTLEFTSAQLQTLSYRTLSLITSGSKQFNGPLLHRRSRDSQRYGALCDWLYPLDRGKGSLPEVDIGEFPVKILVLPEVRSQHNPDTLDIEATGLGGRDLGYPVPWDISLRSDKDGQSVYGPSMATVESTIREPTGMGGTIAKFVTALGLSKATHEFLTLHYFATDSAAKWDNILSELLPNHPLPGAAVGRASAFEMFNACHIAPSHRRHPHIAWTDAVTLVCDLLLGCGAGRYLGCLEYHIFEQWRFEASLRAVMLVFAFCRSFGSFQRCSPKVSWVPLHAHRSCWLLRQWVTTCCT